MVAGLAPLYIVLYLSLERSHRLRTGGMSLFPPSKHRAPFGRALAMAHHRAQKDQVLLLRPWSLELDGWIGVPKSLLLWRWMNQTLPMRPWTSPSRISGASTCPSYSPSPIVSWHVPPVSADDGRLGSVRHAKSVRYYYSSNRFQTLACSLRRAVRAAALAVWLNWTGSGQWASLLGLGLHALGHPRSAAADGTTAVGPRPTPPPFGRRTGLLPPLLERRNALDSDSSISNVRFGRLRKYHLGLNRIPNPRACSEKHAAEMELRCEFDATRNTHAYLGSR